MSNNYHLSRAVIGNSDNLVLKDRSGFKTMTPFCSVVLPGCDQSRELQQDFKPLCIIHKERIQGARLKSDNLAVLHFWT